MIRRDHDTGAPSPDESGAVKFSPEEMERLNAVRAKRKAEEAQELEVLSRQMRTNCETFLRTHGKKPDRWSDIVQGYKDAFLQEVDERGKPIPDGRVWNVSVEVMWLGPRYGESIQVSVMGTREELPVSVDPIRIYPGGAVFNYSRRTQGLTTATPVDIRWWANVIRPLNS